MDEVDPVTVHFEGGPAQGLGPYSWDAPLPAHVFVIRENGRGAGWITVWPGRDLPPGRRHRYDLRSGVDDEWNATYVHSGRIPTADDERPPEVPPTNRRREVPR